MGKCCAINIPHAWWFSALGEVDLFKGITNAVVAILLVVHSSRQHSYFLKLLLLYSALLKSLKLWLVSLSVWCISFLMLWLFSPLNVNSYTLTQMPNISFMWMLVTIYKQQNNNNGCYIWQVFSVIQYVYRQKGWKEKETLLLTEQKQLKSLGNRVHQKS